MTPRKSCLSILTSSILFAFISSSSAARSNADAPKGDAFFPRSYTSEYCSENETKCLPTFTIAGLPKAGTTALWWYLSQHPKILLGKKEVCIGPQWFKPQSETPPNILNTYLHSLSNASSCPDCVTGDSCITQTASFPLLARTSTVLPISHAFVMVRHPLSWLYASYWYWCLPEELEMKFVKDICRRNGQYRRLKEPEMLPDGTVYHSNRSSSDFHDRLFQISSNCSLNHLASFIVHSWHRSLPGPPACPPAYETRFCVFRGFMCILAHVKNVYGSRAHFIDNEDLYINTGRVLGQIQDLLSVPRHDFGIALEQSMNVNDHPGKHAVTKRRGKYSEPIKHETVALVKHELADVCNELQENYDSRLCQLWSDPQVLNERRRMRYD